MSFGRSRRPDDWPTVHDRARSALSDQLDGAIETREAAWLDAHLADCAPCRQVADEYAAQRFALRALRDHQPLPPRDLWARTAAAIELEAQPRSTAGRGFSRRLLLAPSAFIATALVVAVASGLLTSSQLGGRSGGAGSSPNVAIASIGATATPRELAVGPTPIPVRKNVEYVARDSAGNLKLNVKTVNEVCPVGTTEPCDTSAPALERTVTIDQDAQAVYGSDDQQRLIVMRTATQDDPGAVSVVALADEPVVPNSSPSETPPSGTAAPPSESPGPTPTPSTPPTSAPPGSAPPSVPASPSESPAVSASPTASIDVSPPGGGSTVEIARGVALVGQTASYSASGDWFAFTARPLDASAGPDIYVWRVGTPAARKITADGRSVFGSWVGDRLVGSTAVDASRGGGGLTGLRPMSFLFDPASGGRTDLVQVGSAWRPAVDPESRLRAVYWAGTVRTIEDRAIAPDTGKLVLGDWSDPDPGASAEPSATALTGDQSKARHETTIQAGRVDDWDAAWDPTGTHLAVWIADRQDATVGRLSLYAVSQFDGAIDLKSPLLDDARALAGFSISGGALIWAEPANDGSGTRDGTLQLLAWTADGIGTVETFEGSALVIR